MNPAIPAAAGPARHEPAAAPRRTPPKRKGPAARQAPARRAADYTYLKAVFRALRVELGIEVDRQPKKLPYVPTEEEIRRYYQAVRQARRGGDVVLIKTLLSTGAGSPSWSRSASSRST